LAFVDIDNDGDMDAFSSNWDYNIGEDCYFYKNNGSASVPSFSLDTVNNPLDSVKHHLSAVVAPANISANLSFVDIDNDGDMDCFAAVDGYYATNLSDDLWYYENVGTANVPTFIRQNTTANHPFGSIFSTNLSQYRISSPVIFLDVENDGDMDAIFAKKSVGSNYNEFYENTGTGSSPNFVLSITSPIDSAIHSLPSSFSLVDMDGDSDLDVFRAIHNSDSVAYFENTTFTALSKIAEENAFMVFPNPTTGRLVFEKSLTGKLYLFNMTGQEILVKELENTQGINLSAIEDGLYFLTIENDKMRIRKKVLIQK
jgi:hypothetical protein